MFALPNDAPESAAAELAIFDPVTRNLRYLTSGTTSQPDVLGTLQRFTKELTGVTRNGNEIAISGTIGLNFPFLQLPGRPAPEQVTEVIGIAGPVELLNVQTGARRVVGQLGSVPLGPNQAYIGQASGFTADGSKVLIDEVIVQTVPTVVDGRTRFIVPSGNFIAVAAGLVDVASGQLIADITQRINQLAGGDAQLFSLDGNLVRMSGNGNAFLFASRKKLEAPGQPFWSVISASGAQISVAPYVYFRDQDLILPIVDIDVARPRLGGSAFVFIRNVGFSGTVFGIERGASYIGAPPNPSGANTPATVVLGSVPIYITPPTAQPPARGFFANSFALIAPEEDRVYFQHTGDLVPGQNPHNAQELFSIDLQTRQIRQISRDSDSLTVRFANDPTTIFQFGDRAQIVYAGSSSDHRVVAYSNNLPGIFTRSVKQVDAQGRVTLRAARFGTAEYPASLNYPIMVCPSAPTASVPRYSACWRWV